MMENKKGAENSTQGFGENQVQNTQKRKSINHIKDKIDGITLSNQEKAVRQLNAIISSLPSYIKEFINENFQHKRIPKEFMFSSILFAFSNASGLAYYTNVLNYKNWANLYFAIISDRGETKSEPMKIATEPLTKYDDQFYGKYKEDSRLINESTTNSSEIQVNRKQLLLQHATIESAVYTHYKNPYSIGIYMDELMGLIKKMANTSSNEGSEWKLFFLQGNTNTHIDISRKTVQSFRLEKSYPTLLGSIQTEFIPMLFANGNLESGLIDRFLFCNKLTHNNNLSLVELSKPIYQRYKIGLINLLESRYKIENAKEKIRINYSEKAENKLASYAQELLNRKDKLNKTLKAYTAKMEINIHKMILLVHLIKNSQTSDFTVPIEEETVTLSILIIEFYFTNFKMLLEQKQNKLDEKDFRQELIKRCLVNNVSKPQSMVIQILGLSKSQVSKLFSRHKP